jgi:hypothetical protein
MSGHTTAGSAGAFLAKTISIPRTGTFVRPFVMKQSAKTGLRPRGCPTTGEEGDRRRPTHAPACRVVMCEAFKVAKIARVYS